jgi:hypothetical protein
VKLDLGQNKMKTRFYITFCLLAFTTRFYYSDQQTDIAKPENVMAVFIYNFTKFLEWPNTDSEYFYIYILGKSVFYEPLNKIAEKEKVKGRKIIVREINEIDELKRNSILFIPNNESSRISYLIKKTAEKNVLTISDSEGMAGKGICISFIYVDNKVKFEINQKAIEDAGIIPNSRLFTLAAKVYK